MKKHHVEIVFAQGSKADAHNLDDLYERWQMRRGQEAKELKKEPEVIAQIPTMLNPKTRDQAEVWHTTTTTLLSQAQADLSQHNAEHGKSSPSKAVNLTRARLIAQLSYLQALKAYHGEWRAYYRSLGATKHKIETSESIRIYDQKVKNLRYELKKRDDKIAELQAELDTLRRKS